MFEQKYWLSVLNTGKCDQNLQFLPLSSPVHFFSAYCACVNVTARFNSQNQRQAIFFQSFCGFLKTSTLDTIITIKIKYYRVSGSASHFNKTNTRSFIARAHLKKYNKFRFGKHIHSLFLQGHPTIFFCKITVRLRSKCYLKISKAQERLNYPFICLRYSEFFYKLLLPRYGDYR